MTAPPNHPLLPLSQPRHRLSLSFPGVEWMDLSLLDSRLADYGLIQPQVLFPGPKIPLVSNGRTQAQEFLWRAMLLSAGLQQAGNIPCFEFGEIVSLTPTPDSGWQAEIDVVAIDGLPTWIPKDAMSGALKSLFALSKEHSEPTPFSAENLFTALERRLIQPMWSVSPTGKSTIAILLGAYRNRVPFCYVGPGIYQLGWGANAIWIDRSNTDGDSMIGSVASENKAVATRVLRAAGLPATNHILVHNEADALTAMSHLVLPLVVKPADRDRGEGVTIDVNDKAQLLEGFRLAQTFSKNTLIEEQASGVCHRILVANGKLIFAVRRDPKYVEGNGEHTLNQLIENANDKRKNQPPWKRSVALPWDPLAIDLALEQGFTAASIIPKGVKVKLRKIESTEWGGISFDVSKTIHPENIALATRAAALFRLSVCGIDLMTVDIEKSWYETNAKILEVNFAPLFTALQRPDLQDIYIDAMLRNNGHIPIEILEGDGEKSIKKAKQLQSKRLRNGERCFMIQGGQVYGPTGDKYHLNCDSDRQAIRALLMDKSVDSLVVIPSGSQQQIDLISN